MENSNAMGNRLPQAQVKPMDESDIKVVKEEPALESMEDSNVKTVDITQDITRKLKLNPWMKAMEKS